MSWGRYSKYQELNLSSKIRELDHERYEIDNPSELHKLKDEIKVLNFELGRVRVELYGTERRKGA